MLEEFDCSGYWNEDEVSINELTKLIQHLFSEKAEIISRNQCNFFSKLDQSFQSLNKQGVISVHYAGSTQSAGGELINELEYYLLEEASEESIDDDEQKLSELRETYNLQGYCFYHQQDLEGLEPTIFKNNTNIPKGSLYLSFGSLQDKVEPTSVAKKIIQTLKEHDLDIAWSGSEKSRIEIKNVCWIKPTDSEDWGYDRTYSLLLKCIKK